MEHTL